MGKIKKDGVKNIYCATCMKWMTEFYVSRHLHSKFHFTKKFFNAEQHQQKKHSQLKRAKKKQHVFHKNYNSKQKKLKIPLQSKYLNNQMADGALQKRRDVEDLDLREASNRSFSTTFSNNEAENDRSSHVMGQVSPDYLPVSQNCKTPKHQGIFSFEEDTLKKCSHNHSNFLLEGCSDIEPSTSYKPEDREQVKQRLYHGQSAETGREQTSQVPQNLLEALGLNWNDESEWFADDKDLNNTYNSTETSQIPPEIFDSQQNSSETFEQLPIDVVSGVFQSL